MGSIPTVGSMTFDQGRIDELVQSIYQRHICGCCLHITLDDDNIDDDSVRFVCDRAQEGGHQDCIELSLILLVMNETERAVALHVEDQDE